MIVISDTTPILSLLKANRLDLLQKLYESVIIPEAVYNELTMNPLFKDERDKIAGCPFLKIEKAENLKSVRILRDVTGLDARESEKPASEQAYKIHPIPARQRNVFLFL